jgi:hypothetical protein
MSRAEFRDVLGGNDPVAQLAAQGHEPPRPAGTTCDYVRDFAGTGGPVAAPGPSGTPVSLFRYCFAAGRLAQIQRIDLTAPAK